MKKPLPSAQEFVDAARRARHDSLGVASDPEALIHLANVSRRAFLDQKDLLALRDWSSTVEDIANIDAADPAIQRWLETERVRLAEAQRLVADLLEKKVRSLVERLELQQQFLDEAQRTEIATSFETAWHTHPLARVAEVGE